MDFISFSVGGFGDAILETIGRTKREKERMMERTVESSTNMRLFDLDVLGSYHGKRYGNPSALVTIWTERGRYIIFAAHRLLGL